MKDGFPLLTTKKMYYKGIIVELIWFLNGDTNIKYLIENNCNIWNGDAYKKYINSYMFSSNPISYKDNIPGNEPCDMDEFIHKIKTNDWFASVYGDLGPVYGKQWRDWSGLDQITNLIFDLRNNPDSRRLMVNAWNVSELSKMTLPPCHYGFQCYTRELSIDERKELCYKIPNFDITEFIEVDDLNLSHRICDHYGVPRRELSLSWNQRSVDTPLGLPYNIASYALLLEMLSSEVNMVPGEIIGNLGDCHIYLNQIDGIREQLENDTSKYPLSKLKLNKRGLNNKIEDIIIENYQSYPTIKMPLSN
jgi:thymidylate synthase